jgi:hypothetical protein
MGIGLDGWWNDRAYKTCNTFHLRGLLIFDKLKQHDAAPVRRTAKRPLPG